MLLRSLTVSKAEFEAGTGWAIKPEGACKGSVCIPLSKRTASTGAETSIDVASVAADMGLPLVGEPQFNLWALGPAAVGARALTTAEAPDISLPDLDGNAFRLSSLRGQKVLLYAWAPY